MAKPLCGSLIHVLDVISKRPHYGAMKNLFLSLVVLLSLGACSTSSLKPQATSVNSTNSAETLKKPYVILVSIDGYRPDYTRKFSPPNLTAFKNIGASAESMIPVFPSKTFPNHLSIITGRYAENHGIVANYFYDLSRPAEKTLYTLSNPKAVQDGTWYQADPLWVTAEKEGMRTACYFWPGSEAEIGGVRPAYFKTYDKNVTNQSRVDGVLDWLKLPEEKRPHLITLYFSDVDSAGHEHGPDSKEVKEAVKNIDIQIGRLQAGVEALKLPVDLVIVSDHGMAKLDPKKILYLDDLVTFKNVLVGDTGPQLVVYAKGNSPEQKAQLDEVYQALKKHAKHYRVFRRADIPAEYHLAKNPRAGDVLISADLPYSVGIHDPRYHPPVATHGYDPKRYPEMNATFYAKGPDILPKKIKSFKNIDVYPFLMELLKLKPMGQIDGTAATLHSLLKNP